jgi:hypothetical protein
MALSSIGLMGSCPALSTDPSQPIMMQQAAKNRFARALPGPAHPLPGSTLLPVPGAAIDRIKGRAHKLLLGRGWRTTHLQGALLAVLLGGPVVLNPVPVLAGRVSAKREQFASWTAKRISLGFVAKAFGGWFIVPKYRNPGRNSPLFEEGVVEGFGVARIGYKSRSLNPLAASRACSWDTSSGTCVLSRRSAKSAWMWLMRPLALFTTTLQR